MLGEEHRRLERYILEGLVQRRKERKKKSKGRKRRQKETAAPPEDCRKALEAALPAGPESVDIRPRTAGVGSLAGRVSSPRGRGTAGP